MSPSDLSKLGTEPTKIGHIFSKVFQKSKFLKPFLIKSLSPSPIFFKELFLEGLDQFSTLKNDFENLNFQMFAEVVHNCDKSEGDII